MAAPAKPIQPGHVVPPFLELGQFLKRSGETLCFRESCDGCRYEPTCQREETVAVVGPGMNIRRAIAAQPGYQLVAIDFSGIELRLAAEFSREPMWVRAFQDGVDLHMAMARIMFHTDEPTDDQRKKAKVGNFNLLYLGGPGTIRAKTLCSEEEAQEICRNWWATVPTYEAWTRAQWEYAQQHRCVRTPFGRVRHMEELIRKAELETKLNVRGKKKGLHFAKATSVNTVIQGCCADLMKRAIVMTDQWIVREHLHDEVQLLLAVHDELLVQVRDDQHLEERARHISRLMCPPADMTGWIVPITTDIEVGPNWSEIVKLDTLLKRRGQRVIEAPPSTPTDQLILTCTWDVVCNGSLLTAVLDECSMLSQREATSEVLVPLRLRLTGVPSDTSVMFRASESVVRQVIQRYPGLMLTDN